MPQVHWPWRGSNVELAVVVVGGKVVMMGGLLSDCLFFGEVVDLRFKLP
jgi:hypothetical protein